MFSVLDLTQRNQVVWIELQLGMQVKRLDVMDLYSLALVAAGRAGRLAQKMRFLHARPLGAAFLAMHPGYGRAVIEPLRIAYAHLARHEPRITCARGPASRTLARKLRESKRDKNNHDQC